MKVRGGRRTGIKKEICRMGGVEDEVGRRVRDCCDGRITGKVGRIGAVQARLIG